MSTFAVINDNKVENIIVADTKEIAEEVTGKICIEYTAENPAAPGWDYDSVNNVFINPTIIE